MKKYAILAAAAAGLLVGSATFAAAAPMAAAPAMSKWYVGVGVNYNAGWTEKFNDGVTKLDNKKVGWDLFVGNRFNRFVGAEFGYNYLGKLTYKQGNAESKIKSTWDIYAAAMGYLPFAQYFDAYAKAGLAYLNQEQTTDEKLQTILPTYGLGLNFTYQQFGARVYYNSFIESRAQRAEEFLVPSFVGLDIMYYFG